MKYFFTILFSISFSILAFAQLDTEIDNARKSLRYAEELVLDKEYVKAKKQLLHTLKLKKDFAVTHRLLGKVYFELGAYEASAESYEASFDLDNKLSRAAYFECAEAHFNNENIEYALYYYDRYSAMKGKRYTNAEKESGLEIEYDNLLPLRRENCLYFQQLDEKYKTLKIHNLGENINSEYDEYLPSITSDGEHLLFTRNIKSENEDILLSKIQEEQWSDAQLINSINTKNNEGMAKFEAHGNAFYFAGCNRTEEENGCDIYRANFEAGKITEINPVDGRLNSYFWDSQPSVTCDGHIMYFSSTREGGQGGADIWMCKRLPSGEWGVPENLGANVNSPGDEEAPFIATDGITLYFTSNGHAGQGNGDILVSFLESKNWSKPENLGYPINSPAKEIGFYVKGDGKTGYFASARKGGLGGLDIYEVMIPELLRPQPMVQLELVVVDDKSGQPISTDVTIGNDGRKWTTRTDEMGWVFQCLAGNKGYSFQINHPDYKPLIDAVYLEAQDNITNKEVKLKLTLKNGVLVKTESIAPKVVEEPEPEELQAKDPYLGEERLTKTVVQLFFDFDSAQINEKSNKKLDDLSDLINRFDDWNVEVFGYADNVGSEVYNRELSQKRAQVIVDFLQSRSDIKIQTNISAVGKGSTGNTEVDERARRKSRRVDIVLSR